MYVHVHIYMYIYIYIGEAMCVMSGSRSVRRDTGRHGPVCLCNPCHTQIPSERVVAWRCYRLVCC